jgi:hypothetical protein
VISAGVEIPVFVAYNLFTLRADRVVYDVQSRTLEATGNVVAENADGTIQRADSMKFRVENGEAIPLASTLVKRKRRVALDKSEGVVKAQFFLAVLGAPRGCQRRWRTKTLEISR